MKLEDLIDYALAEVPKVPYEVARRALVDVLVDFCRVTSLWTGLDDDAQKIRLKTDTSDYEIEPLTGARAVSVSGITINGRPLTPMARDQLNLYLPDWRTARAQQPIWFDMRTPGIVSVFPTPIDPVDSMVLEGVFVPTLNSTSIPDDIGINHQMTITHGVLEKLLMKKADWQDLKLASWHGQQYKAGRTDARIDQLQSNVGGTSVVRPVRFG